MPSDFTPLARFVQTTKGCSEIIVGELVVKTPYELCPSLYGAHLVPTAMDVWRPSLSWNIYKQHVYYVIHGRHFIGDNTLDSSKCQYSLQILNVNGLFTNEPTPMRQTST